MNSFAKKKKIKDQVLSKAHCWTAFVPFSFTQAKHHIFSKSFQLSINCSDFYEPYKNQSIHVLPSLVITQRPTAQQKNILHSRGS